METNFSRIKETITDMSKFNSQGPGISRFSYSSDDLKARKYLLDICESIGLKVRVDAVGNIFARYEGQQPELEPVVSGSHIDSVKSGGMFDLKILTVGLKSIINKDYTFDMVYITKEEALKALKGGEE